MSVEGPPGFDARIVGPGPGDREEVAALIDRALAAVGLRFDTSTPRGQVAMSAAGMLYIGQLHITVTNNQGCVVARGQEKGTTITVGNIKTDVAGAINIGDGQATSSAPVTQTVTITTPGGESPVGLAMALAELTELMKGATVGDPGPRDAAVAAAEEARAEVEKPASARDATRLGKAWGSVKEWTNLALAGGMFVAEVGEKVSKLVDRIGKWFQ